MTSMYSQYFHECEVRPEFRKEFISLWPGWLGPENLHKLEAVTEVEWSRFNNLLTQIVERHDVFIADLVNETLRKVRHARELMQLYDESQNKSHSAFTKLVIPGLSCALTEEWDFTYILWYKDRAAVAVLAPLISRAQLHHFCDDT